MFQKSGKKTLIFFVYLEPPCTVAMKHSVSHKVVGLEQGGVTQSLVNSGRIIQSSLSLMCVFVYVLRSLSSPLALYFIKESTNDPPPGPISPHRPFLPLPTPLLEQSRSPQAHTRVQSRHTLNIQNKYTHTQTCFRLCAGLASL